MNVRSQSTGLKQEHVYLARSLIIAVVVAVASKHLKRFFPLLLSSAAAYSSWFGFTHSRFAV
jgi:hypothetical protein